MSGLILLALFCFLPPISVVLSSRHLNVTTVISVDPKEEQEYFLYFKHLPNKSPLDSYLHSPRQLYVLCKAAEFAAQNYKGAKEENKFTLRHILSLRNVQDNRAFKYRLLLQDDKTGEHHKADIAIFTVPTNVGGKYRVRVEVMKQKRSGVVENQNEAPCDRLSRAANCSSCGYRGICHKGTARISPWLALALKTQRKLQVNMSLDRVQMLAAHNAFNNRADGYGELDDCHWPPPYKSECIVLANQEFSFTDLLQMGIRAIEIDPWWCFGKVRMSHALNHAYLGCGPWDREFKDGIKEIAEWSKRSENKNEVIRLYLEDGPAHTQGHDALLNGPIKEHFGEKVLTPDDIQTYFNGKWPTLYEMQKLGKIVLISSGNSYNHEGEYIHRGYWKEITTNRFLAYKNCTEAVTSSAEPLRVYSDSTEYGPFWNGPKKTGTILNYMEYLKCGVMYPAADQINPDLLNTAVFTWARNEPREKLSQQSCVVLCAEDGRWHLQQCATKNPYACVSTTNDSIETKWVISSTKGPYYEPACPEGFVFSVPRNAVEHYKLLKEMNRQDIWLNLKHYIPLIIEE
ncbi:uncharacterized protein LOC116307491 [Actinia tenebrosa]|uniref:Uncharacterized protein LOC116307491 n=1 Tax=Actinia tenebrosa TaxID=6105 RepID=A0A6P8J248_ACTTE|nr:uncharacterized protein LOC116307491 [Actinia tenebrosa]